MTPRARIDARREQTRPDLPSLPAPGRPPRPPPKLPPTPPAPKADAPTRQPPAHEAGEAPILDPDLHRALSEPPALDPDRHRAPSGPPILDPDLHRVLSEIPPAPRVPQALAPEAGPPLSIDPDPPAAWTREVPDDRYLEPETDAAATVPLAHQTAPHLFQLLERAAAMGASDLHIHAGAPPRIRRLGRLESFERDQPLDPKTSAALVADALTPELRDRLARDGEIDVALDVPQVGRVRLNAYRQQRGSDVVLRLIPPEPPTLQALGLPETLQRFLDFRTGMVLCTGPAGCGKSTTMAAILNALIQTRREHVITIEDPIEFVYPEGSCWVNQRQVGDHTQSFARALRAALREDPDIIAITELRDRETISLAMSAAETGHLVLGTLHTGNAIQTIHRIINAFSADEQAQVRVMLSESLRAVVSQRLIPRADGQGRIPAVEMLVVTPAVANLIRDDKTFQIHTVMQTGRTHGMLLLDDSLRALVADGTVSHADAQRHATSKGGLG